MPLKAFIAGSLSSSCCFIQLCLNLLSSMSMYSIGCAGFNTTLGPLRPYTRSLTLSWLVVSWFYPNMKKSERVDSQCVDDSKFDNTCCNKTSDRNIYKIKILSTVICIVLMYMPEGLQLVGGSALAPAIGNVKDMIRLEYTVDNMGCEACVFGVEGILTRQPGVISAKVTDFNLGEVEIVLNKAWIDYNKNIFEKSVNDNLELHGYELHQRGWKTKKMKLDESYSSSLELNFGTDIQRQTDHK